MIPESFSPSNVAIRFEEAANTLTRLPMPRPSGYRSAMPTPVFDPRTDCSPTKRFYRSSPPDATQISRLDEVLDWMVWLDEKEKKLIWGRALGTPWRTLCGRMGCSRTSAWRTWTTALVKISKNLNDHN